MDEKLKEMSESSERKLMPNRQKKKKEKSGDYVKI